MCLHTSAGIIPVQFLTERWIVPSILKHPKLRLILIVFHAYLPLKTESKDRQTNTKQGLHIQHHWIDHFL